MENLLENIQLKAKQILIQERAELEKKKLEEEKQKKDYKKAITNISPLLEVFIEKKIKYRVDKYKNYLQINVQVCKEMWLHIVINYNSNIKTYSFEYVSSYQTSKDFQYFDNLESMISKIMDVTYKNKNNFTNNFINLFVTN